MSQYQVTARKWRPQDFSQVVGQEHVTTALTNAIQSGKVPHAYLFSGPRGVGKTSTARILSKLLNCIQSPNICGVCPACQEITSGQSLDVREIDGASNRGIEQIREIRDNAIYTPLSLKYKIFIIDEVHMLTKEASNALLKILEEPPDHVIFMLATTEANKVLPTIRSRCQHYLLKRIPVDTLIQRLAYILDQEGYPYEKEALEEIANAGDGSMRDSQTILDQVLLYSQENITLSATREVLGLPSTIYFEKIVEAFINQDIVTVLEQANIYLMEIGDGVSFAENFTKFLRTALLVKKLSPNHSLLEISQEKYDFLQNLLKDFTDNDTLTLLNLSLELCDTLRKEVSERFWIESTLFKMLDYKNRISLSELRQEIFKVLGRGGASMEQVPAVQTLSNPSVGQTSTSHISSVSDKGSFGAKLTEHQQMTKKKSSIPQAEKQTKKEEVLDTAQPIEEKPTQISNDNTSTVTKELSPQKNVDSQDTLEDTVKNLFEIP